MTAERTPVFLVAAERSGSTLLRLMLAHHPAIAFAGEFDFLSEAISPAGKFMKREVFLRAAERSRLFRHQALAIPPIGNFSAIAQDFIEQLGARKPGAQIIGVTLHRHFDRVLRLWPEARFIHLVRDGRDVALSAMGMGWAGTMWHAIREWVEAETLWQRMSHRLPPERQITINYEELVADPRRELTRACDFLGVGFDGAMLDYPHHSTYAAPFTGSVGRWRKAPRGEVLAAEHRGARCLLQNGYLLSGSVRRPSAIRRLSLNIRNRQAIAAHRRRLLGTGLWWKSLIVQRFGSAEAKALVALREDEIIDRTLK